MVPGAATNGHLVRPATSTRELLRFATAGSVDDGKSTLIGRLLYDSKPILEDQLEHVAADHRAPRRRVPRPRAADRRPARRARAGHHDRRRLPLLRDRRAASSSSPTRRATSSTRATWSPAPRPPTSRSCSSTRARASSSSPAATRSSRRCCASRTSSSCVNKMDLVDFERGALRRDRRGVRPTSPRGCEVPDVTFIPISALHGDNVVEPLGADALVRGAAAALPPRARSRSPPTATSTTRASRCSG